jgi:ribosomal protein L37AE/L43A
MRTVASVNECVDVTNDPLLPACYFCGTSDHVSRADARPVWPETQFYACRGCGAVWGAAPAYPPERRLFPRTERRFDGS